MKSRIRMSDKCQGKIGPTFYIVKISTAVVDYAAVNRFSGLAQYFGGNSSLADVFSPDESLEKVLNGNDANQWPETVICLDCFANDPVLINALERSDNGRADPK